MKIRLVCFVGIACLSGSKLRFGSLGKVLELTPNDHGAWNSRGVALGNLKQFEDEIASSDKAIKLKSDCQEAWYNRAFALSCLERFEEAIVSYEQALKLKPDDVESLYYCASLYGNLGNVLKAIEKLVAALKLDASYLEIAKAEPSFKCVWVYLKDFLTYTPL